MRANPRVLVPVLLAWGIMSCATPAHAICFQFADPFNSTVPNAVLIVGYDGAAVPDPHGELVVVVRSGCNQLMSGQLVELSFVSCGATRIASGGYPPGITADCRPTHRSARRVTAANGEARFIIPGTTVPGAAQAYDCVEILVEGRMFRRARVVAADLDGAGGVGANDLAHFIRAFVTGDATLADMDGDGAIGANDLAGFLTWFSLAGSLTTPAELCP